VVAVDELDPLVEPVFAYGPERPKTVIKAGIIHPNFASTSFLEPKTILHKGKVLKVHGRICYDDIFHKHHWVTFCHVISSSPEGRTPKCVNQNNVDDIDE
jgi:hypothetical protein